MDKYRFGEFIYQRRTSLGLTQEELGRKLGVTNKAVSKWEVGETLPDINLMCPLAEALEVTVDELYQGEIKPKEEIKSIVEKKTPFLMKVIVVILSVIVLGLSGYIVTKNVQEAINISSTNTIETLSKENYLDYLLITPCYRSVNNEDHMTIYGSLSLKDKSSYETEINVSLTYSIQYYYLKTNGDNALITYFNKSVDAKYDNTSDSVIFILDVEPSIKLTDFKEFVEFSFSYEINTIEGEVKLGGTI